jgi:lactate dehydrogenase-like 2-hydroxyacid dehydrogenase
MLLIMLPVTTQNQFSMGENMRQRPPLAGAALDVFLNEPSIDPGFAELDNVVLQPHRSSATVETRTAITDLVRDNLQVFFNGEPLLT